MSTPSAQLEQRAKRRLGRTLKNKYTLERVLGVGGMAAVYLGVHRNGYRVAVKILHPELSIEGDVRARFVREGYVANAIGHQGAVRVLDDDTAEDGAAFLVMELLEGETLQDRSRRSDLRLPHREVCALAHQLLDVLAAAHDKGVVHRDVKPENLFLTRARTLKVLDFGIARIRDDPGAAATGTGVRMGTPAFMPPEQALGRTAEIDARTDVWACGATMFTLLAGRFVHEAATGPELVVHTATRQARSLRGVAIEVPAPIAAVVDRALRFEREERWPSARAMQEALAEAYAAHYGEPISADAIGPVPVHDGAASPGVPAAGTPEIVLGATLPAGPETLDVPSSEVTESAGDPAAADLATPTAREGSSPGPPPTGATLPSGGADAERTTIELDAPPEITAPELSRAPPLGPPPEAPPRPGSPARRAALLALVAALLLGAGVLGARQDRRSRAASVAAVAKPPPGCTDNHTCTAQNEGRPSICRKESGACVALESQDCRVLARPGDVEDDRTIWFGAMFPVRDPGPGRFGAVSMNDVDLGRRDFAEMTGGLPATRPGDRPRPIAVVACDDREDPARVARHLVDEVGVPAIIGFARSKEVLDLAGSVFVPRGVLALASNTSSALRDIARAPGQPRLVFRTTTSVDMVIVPKAALVSEILEPEIRAIPGLLAPAEPIRVVLASQEGAASRTFTDASVAGLRFNGKSVAQNGANFRLVNVPEGTRDDRASEGRARAAAEIAAFAPHLVVNTGYLDAKQILAVERAWPADARFRPRYVSDPLDPADLFRLVQERPDVRRRILRVDTVSSTPAVAKFVMRYNEVFSPKLTAQDADDAAYDAFYVLAYAAAALGDEPITGPSLSRAIGRLLPPGEPVDVGPAGIHRVLTALRSGKNVDLVGAMTSLDFDLETGDATADFAVYCPAPAGRDGAWEMVESGLVYDARNKRLTGKLRCP
jgi:serine/threonine-protein kinase